MAHHRKYVAAAVALNTAIFIVEAAAGYQANSLSLLMDSVHNLSDEMALVAIWLAFIVSLGPSRTLLRCANIFNSIGLIAVSGLLLWESVVRFLHPVPVQGLVPMLVGIGAAAANWAVARLLLSRVSTMRRFGWPTFTISGMCGCRSRPLLLACCLS